MLWVGVGMELNFRGIIIGDGISRLISLGFPAAASVAIGRPGGNHLPANPERDYRIV